MLLNYLLRHKSKLSRNYNCVTYRHQYVSIMKNLEGVTFLSWSSMLLATVVCDQIPDRKQLEGGEFRLSQVWGCTPSWLGRHDSRKGWHFVRSKRLIAQIFTDQKVEIGWEVGLSCSPRSLLQEKLLPPSRSRLSNSTTSWDKFFKCMRWNYGTCYSCSTCYCELGLINILWAMSLYAALKCRSSCLSFLSAKIVQLSLNSIS